MDELFSGWRFAVLRLAANWRLMLVAAAGVLVAATLLAVSPIYAQSMSDLGLRHRLDRDLDEPVERVPQIEVGRLAIGDPVDVGRRDVIDRITEARVGWLSEGELLTEERSQRLDLSFAGFEQDAPEEPVTVEARGAEPVRQPWGAFLFWVRDFEEHVEVTEGRLPEAGAGPEVVLPDGFQRHAALGDVIRIDGPRYDDCRRAPPSEDPEEAADEVRCQPSTFASTSATATVVGFVRPADPDDLRWQLFQGSWDVPDTPFLPRLPPGGGEGDFRVGLALAGEGSMPLLTTEEQFFGPFARAMPELPSRHRAGFVFDVGGLALREVPRAIDDLQAWRSDVNDGLGLPAPARMRVLDVLQTFRNAQTFSQIPLLLILLQVVGIVLYYVAVVMAMLLDRQSEEIGVYRSRGASTAQILGLTLVEGLIVAIPAAAVAPLLAGLLVQGLGYTPTFEPVSGGAALPVSITPGAYLLAAAGAGLSLLAMLLPAFAVARRGIVDVKREQSRPPGRSILQRYYLDIGVVVLAGILLWQLQQRGTVFDPRSVGGWSADPLLLLSPLVLMLAVAALLLRFYPPLLRIAVRVLLVFRSTAIAIGLRRAGRSPGAYARLLLLLIMAIATGTFAASYGPTVDRSLDERIRYSSGADARVALADGKDRELPQKLEAVRDIEGVADAAIAWRGELQTLAGTSVPVLALDADRAASMLWFREDFSEQSLPDLARRLQNTIPPGGGIPIPDDVEALEMNVSSEGAAARELLRVRLRDGSGFSTYVAFEAIEEEGWVTARTEVPSRLERPLTLIGLHVTDRLGQNLRTDGALYIDDITAVRPGGVREVLEDFEGPFRWQQFAERDADEPLSQSDDRATSGEQALKWEWKRSISPRGRIFGLADPAVPVAAVMNEQALGLFGAAPGSLARGLMEDIAVPFSVRAVSSLFPTMNPGRGIVVVNFDQLRSLAGIVDFSDAEYANELWLDFEPGLPLEEQEAILEYLASDESPLLVRGDAYHAAAGVEAVGADPTLQASGSGILVLAFAAVLGLSTLGFMVTLALSARSRTLEFAVLRAVGSSRRQILRAMLLEWGIVLVIGVAIGVILGRQLARVMLSFLEVTEGGARVLPPFVLETDWFTLGAGLVVLVVLVALSLSTAWVSAMRRAGSAVLRITQ